jgi:hypothetical protein
MKKLIFLLMAVAFFSCKKESITTPPQTPNDIEEAPPINPSSTRVLLPGDPNLNASWNWEGSEWPVFFTSISGTIGTASTVNPFYNDQIFGNADPTKMDMRAADGWMLVARDFGTATAAPRQPWIMLYNRFRGILRACVLRTSDLLTSDQNLSLLFDNTVVAPQLFRFTGETEQLAKTKTGSLQWMVGEFNLQGYDAVINQQARLRLIITEVASHSFTLNGGITLDGTAQAQPSKKSVVGTVYKAANHVSKIWDKIAEVGKDVVKIKLAGVAKNPFAVTSAIAGLIETFSSSGKSPAYNIQLKGDVSLEGNMSLSTQRGTIEVYLRTDANNSNLPKALNTIPWGVMNYSASPTVTITTYFVPGIREIDRITRTVQPGFFNNILVINPSIASSVATIEAGWIYPDRDDVQFLPLTTFQSDLSLEDVPVGGTTAMRGIAVRLTFANGDVVYNRFPVINRNVRVL